MKNRNYLFISLFSIFFLTGCMRLIAKSIRFIEQSNQRLTSEALGKEYEVALVATEEAKSDLIYFYEKTAISFNEERVTESKKDFRDIQHNLSSLINFNLFRLGKERILANINVGIDCNQIYENVPISNKNNNLDDRLYSLLKIFDQYYKITIYELSPPIDQDHVGYQIEFMDNDDIPGNDFGLVLIYEKSNNRFFYQDISCWLYQKIPSEEDKGVRKMGIKIPYGRKFIVEVSGSIEKEIVCSYCGKKFILKITRIEKGKGDSLLWLDNEGALERAKYNAILELDNKLQNDVYIKPCPFCGKYQDDMVKELKQKELYKAQNAGVFYFAIGLVFIIIISLHYSDQRLILNWSSFMRLLILSISVYFGIRRIKKAREYNPNDHE